MKSFCSQKIGNDDASSEFEISSQSTKKKMQTEIKNWQLEPM